MSDALNQVDLAFVIDTTGSMGSFINEAREQMRGMLRALSENPALPLDLRVGFVEYRDHPPQESSFAARVHPFTADLDQVQARLRELTPNGGGDAPESVYDGVLAACTTLLWRAHSRRVVVLIGDAPPHNAKTRPQAALALYGDCTCGLTLDEVSAAVECARVTLYAIDLTGSAEEGFDAIARMCGGACFRSGQGGVSAIDTLRLLLEKDFLELDFDRAVLAAWNAPAEASIDRISEALQAGPGRVARSLERLARRELLDLSRLGQPRLDQPPAEQHANP